MARAKNRDWTIEELKRIVALDGENAFQLAEEFNVSRNTIYSMRTRIKQEGGIENVIESMVQSRQNRYNKGGTQPDKTEPLSIALNRPYQFRTQSAGRGGRVRQYNLTIPPALAQPFIDKYGELVMYKPIENGILIVPAEGLTLDVPDWLKE